MRCALFVFKGYTCRFKSEAFASFASIALRPWIIMYINYLFLYLMLLGGIYYAWYAIPLEIVKLNYALYSIKYLNWKLSWNEREALRYRTNTKGNVKDIFLKKNINFSRSSLRFGYNNPNYIWYYNFSLCASDLRISNGAELSVNVVNITIDIISSFYG